MGDCKETAKQLPQYVDESLDAAQRAHVARHLTACPPCRNAATAEHGGRTLLRAGAQRLPQASVPPGLRGRCEALARAQCRARASSWLGGLVPVAAVVALIGATGAAIFIVATARSSTLLAAQLTADHVKCFRLFPPGGAVLDAQQVETMLEQRYGWTVHVPASSDTDGLRLLGGRRCLYANGRIPHLMYQVHGQNVSLFILEGVTRNEAEITTLGHHARVWSRGANTFVLVSPDKDDDLLPAVRYVRQGAR